MIQEFDRAGTNVPDRLLQATGDPLYFVERVRQGNAEWPFFENLLKAALGGLIVTVERHGVTVFVADKLPSGVHSYAVCSSIQKRPVHPGREMYAPSMDRVGGQRKTTNTTTTKTPKRRRPYTFVIVVTD
jgi:hypothetical protein